MCVHFPIRTPDRFLGESKNGKYGAAVACIDWAAGVILHERKTLGLEDNTLVIFTSDNGSRCRGEGGSNGELRGTKATTWEGGQRVPFIMRWPNRIPESTVCRELATAVEFFPTLAELGEADVPQDRTIDGKSILSLILSGGTAESSHDTFFYYMKSNLEAVRDGTWKLHVCKWDQELRELHNLKDDPGERQNVYDSPPSVVADLSARLEGCRQDIGDEACNIQDRNVRAIGRVDNPDTLTQFDPEHPYIVAMYDLKGG